VVLIGYIKFHHTVTLAVSRKRILKQTKRLKISVAIKPNETHLGAER